MSYPGGGEGMGVRGNGVARKRKPINVARALRKRNIPAEGLLWKALRNRALAGFKFRRQHPIGPYIVDFASVACKVIVEADGESHVEAKEADEKRTMFLADQGWHVLRFWNSDVYDDLDSVKEAIYCACAERAKTNIPLTPIPSPPPAEAGERLKRLAAGERGGARIATLTDANNLVSESESTLSSLATLGN